MHSSSHTHMKKFHITIASHPQREHLVSEIFYEGIQWAEISQEDGQEQPVIEFYPPSDKDYWEFPLDEALEALVLAKAKFLKLGDI